MTQKVQQPKHINAFTKEVILNAEKEHKRHKNTPHTMICLLNEEQRQEAKLEKIMELAN